VESTTTHKAAITALEESSLPEEQEQLAHSSLDESEGEEIELQEEGTFAVGGDRTSHEPHQEPDYALPPELEPSPPRSSLLGGFLWSIGILLMLATLALQYVYYYRQAYAENPQLRPVLAEICRFTGCELPPRRDLSAIVLGDHLVQSHPRYKDSLLITATLINRADFAQPYPVLEVIMTDLQQNEIARRRFLPNEYLVGENGAKEFAPRSEVPVMLEVLDPGKQAVGFEFNFY